MLSPNGHSPGESSPVQALMGLLAEGPRALTGRLCLPVIAFDTRVPQVVPAQRLSPERMYYTWRWTVAAGQNRKSHHTQQRLHKLTFGLQFKSPRLDEGGAF